MQSICKLLILAQGAALAWPCAAWGEPGLLVTLIDGQRISAPVADMPWMSAAGQLPEAGPVLIGEKPVRWIRDPQQPQSSPTGPVVEFFGGDALPAKVVAYEKASDSAHSYLLLEPGVGRDDSSDKRQPVRVSTAWIKRVVWEPRRGSRYEPGSLFYRDGRQTSFRAARWTEGGVRLLEEQGTALVTFDQIAELHFPLADAWSTYVGQLALLSPDASGWLLRIETAAGLTATTSTTRSRWIAPSAPVAGGAPSVSRGPSVLLQPAWSLDPLSVDCAGVRGWTFFAPDEVPLSSLEPRRAVQRAMLGAGWPQYTVDCNVQGGPLRSGGDPFGWGYGVHAYSQLEFELPIFARSFSVRLGLDEAVGVGGCVKAMVSISGPHAATLFTSPTMIGSSQTIATGRLDLHDKLSPGVRLRLTVDPLAGDRPARADPLDIRDTFDWLEPLVQLDLAALRRALASRHADALWPLAGWTLVGESGKDWRVVNRPRSLAHVERGFRPMLEAMTSPLVLRRKIRLAAARNQEASRDQLEWLCRPRLAEGAACTVEVVVDGRRLDALRIAHDEQMSGPRRISLAAFAGHEVELTIKLATSHPPLVIDWERLELVAAEQPQPDKP